jgi:diguanylate cyclase (GGDEF)-like protein
MASTLEALERRRLGAEHAAEAAAADVAHLRRRVDAGECADVTLIRCVSERWLAARDRLEAASDRLHAAQLSPQTGLDTVTGVLRRDTGHAELAHALDLAQRQGTTLVVAFLDVDGLKTINDTGGHSAGDSALRAVGEALRRCLRSCDVVVRFGGDEFVCALSGLTLSDAGLRFEEVTDVLAALSPGTSVSVGLSVTDPFDTLESVLARADAELCALRRHRSPHRPAAAARTGAQPARRSTGPGDLVDTWPPTAASVGAARRRLPDFLHDWGIDGLHDVCTVVLSELATNALLHAGTPFTVTLSRMTDGVLICVDDSADGHPAPVPPVQDRAGGLGLHVVDELAAGWGSVPDGEGGKRVWALIADSSAVG